jgi:hypothetical protein
VLTIDEKTYKKIASNLSKEVNQITGTKTISSSKALEILAQSFGYKNYNSILPVLSKNSDSEINIYNSKEDLISNGFKNILDIKTKYLSKLSNEAISDIQKNYQVQLFHFFKAAFLTKEDKFYIEISINELKEYYKKSALVRKLNIKEHIPSDRTIKRDIDFLQLTLGVVFRAIMKNENSSLILYVNKKELFNFNFVDDEKENRNFFLKFSNDSKRENKGEITGENELYFFVDDENEEKSINKIYENGMVFFNDAKELRMANRLIGDWTNKEINNFFELSKDGLIRAKYITRYYPSVSSFISSFIYGYSDMDNTERWALKRN